MPARRLPIQDRKESRSRTTSAATVSVASTATAAVMPGISLGAAEIAPGDLSVAVCRHVECAEQELVESKVAVAPWHEKEHHFVAGWKRGAPRTASPTPSAPTPPGTRTDRLAPSTWPLINRSIFTK